MSLKLSEPMSQPWHSSAPARVDGAAAANTELSGRTIDSEDNLDKALVHAKDDVQIGYALNAVQHQRSAPTDLFGTAHVGGRETVEMLSRMKCSEVFRLSHEVSGGGLPSHTGTTVIDTPGSQIDLDHAQKVDRDFQSGLEVPLAQSDPIVPSQATIQRASLQDGGDQIGNQFQESDAAGSQFPPTWPWTQLPVEEAARAPGLDLPPFELPAFHFAGQGQELRPAALISLFTA